MSCWGGAVMSLRTHSNKSHKCLLKDIWKTFHAFVMVLWEADHPENYFSLCETLEETVISYYFQTILVLKLIQLQLFI